MVVRVDEPRKYRRPLQIELLYAGNARKPRAEGRYRAAPDEQVDGAPVAAGPRDAVPEEEPAQRLTSLWMSRRGVPRCRLYERNAPKRRKTPSSRSSMTGSSTVSMARACRSKALR